MSNDGEGEGATRRCQCGRRPACEGQLCGAGAAASRRDDRDGDRRCKRCAAPAQARLHVRPRLAYAGLDGAEERDVALGHQPLVLHLGRDGGCLQLLDGVRPRLRAVGGRRAPRRQAAPKRQAQRREAPRPAAPSTTAGTSSGAARFVGASSGRSRGDTAWRGSRRSARPLIFSGDARRGRLPEALALPTATRAPAGTPATESRPSASQRLAMPCLPRWIEWQRRCGRPPDIGRRAGQHRVRGRPRRRCARRGVHRLDLLDEAHRLRDRVRQLRRARPQPRSGRPPRWRCRRRARGRGRSQSPSRNARKARTSRHQRGVERGRHASRCALSSSRLRALLDLVDGLHRAREHHLVGRVVVRDHHVGCPYAARHASTRARSATTAVIAPGASPAPPSARRAGGRPRAIGGAEHARRRQRRHLAEAVARHVRWRDSPSRASTRSSARLVAAIAGCAHSVAVSARACSRALLVVKTRAAGTRAPRCARRP